MNQTLRTFLLTVCLGGFLTVAGQNEIAVGQETLVVEPWIAYPADAPIGKTNIVVVSGATLHLSSDLMLEGSLSVHGSLVSAVPVSVVAGKINLADNARLALAPGSSLAFSSGYISNEMKESLVKAGIAVSQNPSLSPMAAMMPTCGNGAGQTPFTINASVVTNFNGFQVSCNGANDGIVTVNISGGIGPFFTTWFGGSGVQVGLNYTQLGAGTYTVLVTDQGQGITCVDNVQVTVPSAVTIFSLTTTPPSCLDACNGSAVPIAIGGTFDYIYSWSSGETTPTASALCSGPGSLTVTDSNGCSFTQNFSLNVNPVQSTLDTQNILCFGTATGSATVSPSGGAGAPYAVQWSSGGNGLTETGLTAGSYTVTVADAAGCEVELAFEITQEPPLQVALESAQNPVCGGDFTGAISVTVAQGTPGYTFAWEGPDGFVSNQQNISGLQAGSYSLTVTDSNGCESVFSQELTAPEALDITAVTDELSCFGQSDGSINVTVTGGSGSFSFVWSGPNGFSAFTEDLSGLSSGNYSVVATDTNGCEASADFQINEPTEISAIPTTTPITCNGASNGQISVSISGGTPGYTVNWTVPGGFSATGAVISDLEAGSYNATITDANGCSITLEVVLENPEAIQTALTTTPVSCTGATTGTISLTISGGTPGYTTAWTGPGGFASAAQNLTGLAAGTYNVTVTDSQGCFVTASATVTEPDPITITPLVTHVSCGGAADGAISLTVSGGVPGYAFAWSGPGGFASAAQNISALSGGDYTVVVTDASGCQQTQTFTVNENPPLEVTIDFNPLTCSGANDGSAALTITGGTPGYTISWSGPGGFSSAAQNISGLAPGSYTATVTDVTGCVATATFELIDPQTITVEVAFTPISCFGANDGSISLTISGGTPGYTTQWTGPGGFASVAQNLTGLAAGTYNVTVTDSQGCFVTATATITEPEELTVVALMNQISCGGAADGSISITVAGGVPDYVIAWTGPGGFTSSQTALTNLGPGDYNLTITDAAGCQVSQLFTLAQAPELVLSLSPVNISCFGESDGLIDLTIEGGTAGYLISWTGPNGFVSASEDQTGLAAGTYEVQVVDAEGCSAVAQADIIEPLPFTLDEILVTEILCADDATGQIQLVISGGVSPLSISWNVGASSNPLTGLAAGTYSATITDNAGCQLTTGNIVLNNPTPISIVLTGQNILCFGQNTGSITALVSGGTGNLSLSWSGPSGFVSADASLSNLLPGNYQLTVTDENGCAESASIDIIEPAELTAVNNITQPFCPDDLGAFNLTVSGGAAPYTIAWSGPGGFVSDQLSIANLISGAYALAVTDANGCEFTDDFALDSFTQFGLTAAIVPLDCSNLPVASITLTLAGGTDPYTLLWNGPNGFVSDQSAIFNLSEGTYDFVLTDANGCQLDTSFVLIQPPLILVDASVISAACNGPSSGSISLDVSGGVPPFSFLWSGPSGFGSVSQNTANLGPGEYTVNITDNGDCPFTETYTISDQPEVQLEVNVTFASCGGANDGLIDLTISGGSAPFTTSWVGPLGFSSTNEDLSGLAPGTYTVSVTDANGCLAAAESTITEPQPLAVSITAVNPTCGVSSGSLEAVVTGGAEPYEFLWTSEGITVGTGAVIMNQPAGIYSVQITDAAGCVLSDLAALSDFPGAVDALVTSVSCNGLANGAVQITITDGSAPFGISWAGPGGFVSEDQDIFNLIAGDYALEVTDADGCILAEVYEVSEPDAITSSTSTQNISCFGSADGQISLEIFGGTASYTVAWAGPNGFSSDQLNLVNLAPGMYEVSITDDNGCEATAAAEITENAALDIVFDATATLCFGATDGGFIEITVSGGQSPFTFEWTLPDGSLSNLEDLIGVGSGTFDLTATDANGCTGGISVSINEAPELSADFAVIAPTCLQANGSIEPLPAGGIPGYAFIWNDITTGTPLFVSDQATAVNLTAGLYEVQMTDALGCLFTDIVPLSDQDNELNAALISPLCFGGNDGSITVTVVGLIDPLVFDWTGPNGFVSAAQNITDLTAGTYTLVATDAFGCVASDVYDLSEPDALSVTADINGLSCPLAGDGTISLSISGGTEPFQILWIGPDFTSDQDTIVNLDEGCYELFVTDANGCQFQDIFCIDVEDPITATAAVASIICAGTPTGAIDLTLTGGAGGYALSWEGPNGFSSDQEDLSDLLAGLYTVAVTDSLGCSAVFAFQLDENPAPELTAVVTDVLCQGQYTGSIAATVSGGAAPISLSWTGPQGYTSADTLLLGLGAGTYVYLLTDSLGCSFTDTLTVAEPSGLQLEAAIQHVQCFGQNNGAITLTIGGTTPGFDVFWTGPGGFNTVAPTIQDLAPGAYQASVTDTLGCISNFFYDISEPAELILTITETGEALCEASADGFVNTDISGGVAPYVFSWTTGFGTVVSTDQNPTGLLPGFYEMSVTDSVGCLTGDGVLIDFNLTVEAFAGADTSICSGNLLQLTGLVFDTDVAYWTDTLGVVVSDTLTFDILLPAGEYTFLLHAGTAPCSALDTLVVTVLQTPTVDAGPDFELFPEQQAVLGGGPTTDTGNALMWSPTTFLNDAALQNPTMSGQTGDLWYVATATAPNGCSAMDSAFVVVIPPVTVPSGFSPNGDGYNEYFQILGVEKYPSISVDIFNRWGALLFSSKGYQTPWDGRHNDAPLPMGTYYYVIEINEPEFRDTLTGPVTIIR